MGFWEKRRVVLSGGNGFLGSFVVDKLRAEGCSEISAPHSLEYDLREKSEALRLYKDLRPDIFIHLAAVVGGIGANRANPGRFFYDNAVMGINAIEAGRIAGVEKFVCAGTICSYPKFTPVPFREENFWDGYPEETNAPYGSGEKNAARPVAGLPAAVWICGDLSYSSQFVWTAGQLRSGKLARYPRIDPQMLGSETVQRGGNYGVGYGQCDAGILVCGGRRGSYRHRRREVRETRTCKFGVRAKKSAFAICWNSLARWLGTKAPSAGMQQSRTDSRGVVWTRHGRWRSLDGKRRRRYGMACGKPLRGMVKRK